MGGKNKSFFNQVLQKVTHQSDVTPAGLKKYPLVIVGAHAGGHLTRIFEGFDHGHTQTFVVYDSMRNYQQQMRPFFEMQEIKEVDYVFSPKVTMAAYVASSDGVGLSKIDPAKNSITLENGQTVEYEQLVLSYGMKDDFDNIKGFRKAWEDEFTPVYTTANSDRWPANYNKHARWIGNYTHGDAYFYIPKFPFRGEIAYYHFLQAFDYWQYYKKIGKVSPISSFTIVNANDRMTSVDTEANNFILAQIEKRGIPILFNTELVEVKTGNEQKIILRSNGKDEERDFNNLYVLPAGVVPKSVAEAGLGDSQGFLDVDPVTLRSRKYENIFGLGDITNIPITKSYWATWMQIHGLRNNLVRVFKGLPINAPYGGYSAVPFITGTDTMVYFEKDFKGSKFWNLFGAGNSFIGRRLYSGLAGKSKSLLKVHLGKEPGPPYGKFNPFGKRYKGAPIETSSETVTYKPKTPAH